VLGLRSVGGTRLARAGQHARHLRWGVVAATCGGMIALGIGVGLWAGQSKAPRPIEPLAATRAVRAGAATLTVPTGWRIVALPAGGAGGTSTSLTPASGSPDRVIVTVGEAVDRSLVPPQLRRLVLDLGRGPQPVNLAGHRAWRYATLPARNSNDPIDVTVLPTTAGVLGIACASSGWSWSAPSGCSSSIESVAVDSAEILVPQPDLAFRLRLPAVLDALNQARVRDRAALRRATTAKGQAQLAQALAREHLAAADSLRPAASAAGTPLVDRLTDTARAYDELARAAAGGSAARYAAARQRVTSAEEQLAAAADKGVQQEGS
jgi:hypothetical protein